MNVRLVSYDLAIEIAASSQNSLAGGSRGERLTVAKVNLGPAVATILPQNSVRQHLWQY